MAWETAVERTYPAWYAYSGQYSQVVATFKTGPEQLTWVLTDPIGEWIADEIEKKAVANGATPLYFRLMKNTDPTWTTDWQVDFWAHGTPLAAALPYLIIAAAITAVGLLTWGAVQIVSHVTAVKVAEAQQATEQARIDFIATYEPKLGYQATMDLLNGVTKPTFDQTTANPSLMDDLKKAIVPAVSIGAVVLIGALIFFGLQYLPKPKRSAVA